MKEFGGFLELEINQKKEYHSKAIKLNSGRNALKYILMARKFRKIYLPYFICDGIIQSVRQAGVEFDFYYLDVDFQPLFFKKLLMDEALLVVDYFGIHISKLIELTQKYHNLIVDNSQAFFAKPVDCVETFYSPRKFFGVPDGAYLYTATGAPRNLEMDFSHDRCNHLLKRMDINAEAAYQDFQQNEINISLQPLKQMSLLTQILLSGIDYKETCSVRNNNFLFLQENLAEINELKLDFVELNGPLAYPLMIRNKSLRERLRENKIFIPIYWREVLPRVEADSFETHWVNYLLPLPIDQRYSEADMKYIVERIFSAL